MHTSSQAKHKTQATSRVVKSFKARMDKKRTRLEVFADASTRALGSNTFLFLNAIVFIVWLLINSGIVQIIPAFDPFPFSFLTSAVSLEAIILAILVLISQNRAAYIADVREEIDMQVNIIAEAELTKIMSLLKQLAEKNGINLEKDTELRDMLESTNVEKIEKTIENQLS